MTEKKIDLIIKECKNCPYYVKVDGVGAVCVHKLTMWARIKSSGIPYWCLLEDNIHKK